MMRPSDVDPRDIATAGGGRGAMFGMPNFKIGGSWDYQRVGPDRIFVSAFTDFANVSIGIYAAAVGLPEGILLSIADKYAEQNSKFAQDVDMDKNYGHLRAANVFDIKLGYKLYATDQIKSTIPKRPEYGD